MFKKKLKFQSCTYRALSDLFSFAVLSGNASMAVHLGSARTGRKGRMGRMGGRRAYEKKGDPRFLLSADIWSTTHRAWLGNTAHWLKEKNIWRKSAALCCKRMKGRHNQFN
jgi:hypothetical protein